MLVVNAVPLWNPRYLLARSRPLTSSCCCWSWGGSGDRVLRIAARTADIVGINGFFQIEGQPGLFRLSTAAAAGERNDCDLAVVPGRT